MPSPMNRGSFLSVEQQRASRAFNTDPTSRLVDWVVLLTL